MTYTVFDTKSIIDLSKTQKNCAKHLFPRKIDVNNTQLKFPDSLTLMSKQVHRRNYTLVKIPSINDKINPVTCSLTSLALLLEDCGGTKVIQREKLI